MQANSRTAICPVRYCGRLVSAALSIPTHSSREFNTKAYCSQRCADLHACGEHRAPCAPLITCDICIEDKPLTDYIHKIKEHGVVTGQWNTAIPSGCLPHVAPELLDLQSGVCIDCLRSHILTQFEGRGAVNINCCVQTHPPAPEHIHTWSDEQATLTAMTTDWLPYAHRFLPRDLHDAFYRQLFDSFIHTTITTLWVCPSDCGYGNGVLEPHNTPGFPHVECPGCHGRFCANCKVPWHAKQTCQQYRAIHPEVRDTDEVKQLREMARLDARRCPRCQFVITKDGGCDHMSCEQCHFDFAWPQAEIVVAPVESYVPAFVPASTTSASTPTFRGWGQLRQVQEEYTTQNNIANTPFDVGTSGNPREHEVIIFYDLGTGLWSESCEIDALAAAEAGKRFIRHPSHDRGDLWAFIQVGREHAGGNQLQEALEQHWQPPNAWVAQGDAEEGFGAAPFPGNPAIEAMDRAINDLIAQGDLPADDNTVDTGAVHGEDANVATHVIFGGMAGLSVVMQVPPGHAATQAQPVPFGEMDIEDLIDRMLGIGW